MFRRKEFYTAACLLCLVLCQGQVVWGQAAAPAPGVIIKKMIARYASLKSYQDTGGVRLLQGNEELLESPLNSPAAPSQGNEGVFFKTYFARPRLYRFDWSGTPEGSSRESSVWSDGRRNYCWIPNPALDAGRFFMLGGQNLSAYTSLASRHSGLGVFNVSSLMIKDALYSSFDYELKALSDLSLLGEEVVDGESCYVIRGKAVGKPWVLWVGKNSQLLRKTRTVYVRSASFHEILKKGTAETVVGEEIHRDIKIDAPIPRAVFQYKPQLRDGDLDMTR
jgi:outer membrane lipoprotein-sorting protein